MSLEAYFKDLFALNSQNALPETRALSNSPARPSSATSSNDHDNHASLIDRMTAIMRELVNRELTEAGKPTPNRLGEMFEVFQSALAHPKPRKVAEKYREIFELFAKQCLIEYISLAGQFSTLCKDSFKDVTERKKLATDARNLLAKSVKASVERDVSSARLTRLSEIALDSIKDGDTLWKKFAENSTYAEQFYSSLMSLEIRLLVHPWTQNNPDFKDEMSEVTSLIDNFNIAKSL